MNKKNSWLKKRPLLLSIILVAVIVVGAVIGSQLVSNNAEGEQEIEGPPILELESKKSFDFFWNEANTDKNSPGYGLIRDRAPGNPNLASVASVGFGLTALAIGAEREWITQDEAKERVDGTLDTFLNEAEHVNGVFYHFLNMDDAKRAGLNEVSIIDTAILVSGAITAGEYFEGDIKEKADEIYKRVDWDWYRDENRNMFYMSYTPEDGFSG